MISIKPILNLQRADIHQLIDSSREEELHFVDKLRDEWESGINRFKLNGERLLTACDDSKIIGICGINRDPYTRDYKHGRIRRFYILPKYRNKGIGKTMLHNLIDKCTFNQLNVRTHNDRTGIFYESNGFKKIIGNQYITHTLFL